MYIEKFDLTNKVAIITGGAGLLGKQHALALGNAGANVFVSDINLESCEKTCRELSQECKNESARFFAISLDVTNEESITNAKKEILDAKGKVDILINNAAIDPKMTKDEVVNTARLEYFPLESWNFQISVGLTGAFLCAKHFGQWMADNGGGVILNIASDLSVLAPDQRIYQKEGLSPEKQNVKPVTYSVIKSGLVGLTKYLATYWAEQNVRTNALSPGGVFNNHPDEFLDKLTKLIPLGRMANKDEYHGCVQFLCSDASSYINGINLLAEGGRSVW